MKHKTTKIRAGRYKYRGYRIRRRYETPHGYWGAWIAIKGGDRIWTDSLTRAKELIDGRVEE